jgi:hypothetical protein
MLGDNDWGFLLYGYVLMHDASRILSMRKAHYPLRCRGNCSSFEFLEATVYGHPEGGILWKIGKPIY